MKKEKICKECQFEEDNGHSHGCPKNKWNALCKACQLNNNPLLMSGHTCHAECQKHEHTCGKKPVQIAEAKAVCEICKTNLMVCGEADGGITHFVPCLKCSSPQPELELVDYDENMFSIAENKEDLEQFQQRKHLLRLYHHDLILSYPECYTELDPDKVKVHVKDLLTKQAAFTRGKTIQECINIIPDEIEEKDVDNFNRKVWKDGYNLANTDMKLALTKLLNHLTTEL